jgi:hypothetical protein
MTKFVKIALAVTVVGLLVTLFVFPYYGFHMGIKPCEGLPSDAANCGDADLGGVMFVVIGVPIMAAGLVSLLCYGVVRFIKRKKK